MSFRAFVRNAGKAADFEDESDVNLRGCFEFYHVPKGLPTEISRGLHSVCDPAHTDWVNAGSGVLLIGSK